MVTLGRGADPAHVLIDEPALRRAGIERYESGRGGDVTYHGPGQLIGWPVVRLSAERRDVHRYLRDLEAGLMQTLTEYGIESGRVDGLTGVWAGGRKVAAIGVRLCSGWITSHGFALNVTTDLAGFRHIVPCGISGRGVTSMAELAGRTFALAEVAARVAVNVSQTLGYEPRPASAPAELLGAPAAARSNGVAA